MQMCPKIEFSSNSFFLFKRILYFLSLTSFLFLLCSCGTLTGIPSHGGGKRFATEQRLIFASIRATLKDMDVTKLRGKRTAIIFDLISDEGGGNLAGGRLNLGAIYSIGSMVSPTTTATSAFQIFDLKDSGTNYSNTSGSSSSGSETVTLSNGSASSSGTTNNSGSSSGSSTNTSSGSSTNTSSGTNQSSGTNSTTTGGITTNGTFDQTGSSTDNSSGASTTNGSTTNSNSSNSSSSNSSNNASSNSSSTIQNASSANNSSTSGGYNRDHQEISPTPSQTITKTEGSKRELKLSAAYRGLGEYINFNVPKSDASLLMGLVRNYLLLNGVTPTTPTDRQAEILLYITVDIFGIVRSRFDALLYNNERVKAETSFEMMAFNQNGEMIMPPQSASRMAQYTEHYLLWAGPVVTNEKVKNGAGLLVDFSDVDGTKANYNTGESADINYILGEN